MLKISIMVKQGIIKNVRQGIKGKTRSKNKSELRIKCLIIKQDANDIPVFQVIHYKVYGI
jgi:hypothetical protein